MQFPTRRQSPELAIAELAVDPTDVDRETYPVRIRLTRSMTPHEQAALTPLAAGAELEESAILLPEAKLDDVAHEIHLWAHRIEQAARVAESSVTQAAIDASAVQQQILEEHQSRQLNASSYYR